MVYWATKMTSPITITTGGQVGEVLGPLRLVVADGVTDGKSIDLPPGTYRIGKSPDCDLQLDDPHVSREHLVMHVSEQGVHVRDLGSKNGSTLGGMKLVEGILYPGAILQIGETRLRLVSALPLQSRPPSPRSMFGSLYGDSLAMREAFALLEVAASTDTTVLIEAETGTGKELCAQAIHEHSRRRAGPFVICDLTHSAGSLVESELFGHVRGAFTGAHQSREGAFVAADRGTLFLDEIGELPLEQQPLLLRAIEARQAKPLGSDKYKAFDIRIVAATNRNLEEEVRAGRFRQDLFYRLAVIRMRLPPLRERKQDIAGLAKIFLRESGLHLPTETLSVLSAYDWPGNVRELHNVITRGVAHSGPGATRLEPASLGLDRVGTNALRSLQENNDKRTLVELRDQLIAAWEREYLEQLMDRCKGNVSDAAREGGIDRAYLHRLLKRHGVGRWAR